MSEHKLFQSVFLTLIAYGLVSYFQSGAFLVPFPVFELVVLTIALYFGVKQFNQNKSFSVFLILFGFFQFFGRIYNYNFFMSDEAMQRLSETFFVDITYLLSGVFLGILFYIHNRKTFSFSTNLILSITLIVGISLPYQWLIILPLIAIVTLYVKMNVLFTNQHSFWLYLLVFAVSRELTLNLI